MYKLNDIFYVDKEYADRADYCNKNGYRIVEIEPDGKGRRFQIQQPSQPSEERILQQLREQRTTECFSIVNQNFIIDGQSKTWFDTLTDKQKIEASIWVQAWRDVTETKIIPNKPEWLN